MKSKRLLASVGDAHPEETRTTILKSNIISAYICQKEHIIYLLQAAMSRRLNPHGGHFTWNAAGHAQAWHRGELACNDYEHAAKVANMLWRENKASVLARYGRDDDYSAIEEIKAREIGVFHAEIDPVQVLKSCDCLEYQSCEHDGWEASEAKAFLEALRGSAWRSLPGYEKAAWGPPEKRGPVLVSLSSLAGRRN
jgi:hypothetical protein